MSLLLKRGLPISLVLLVLIGRLHWELPLVPSAVLLQCGLSCAVSFLLARDLIFDRRSIALAFLLSTGAVYFLAASLGLLRHWGLVESGLWADMISPYPCISIIRSYSSQPHVAVARRAYYVLPTDEPHYLFSGLVLGASVISIFATMLMLRNRKLGERIWVILLALSVLSLSGYVWMAKISWGFRGIASQLLFEALYICAFAFSQPMPHSLEYQAM
jgi:hypothetical protein